MNALRLNEPIGAWRHVRCGFRAWKAGLGIGSLLKLTLEIADLLFSLN